MEKEEVMIQKLTKEEKELVDLIYTRLKIWNDGCKEIHEQARTARKILLLQDPDQDPKNSKHKTIQLQTLLSTFNNCVADQMDNVMEAVMTPERAELQEVADDLNDIVRFVYEQNEYLSYHRQRVIDYLGPGTAVCEIMWDTDMHFGKGDIRLNRVPIEQFLWDPAEDDIQNGRANMKVSWHPLSWYKDVFPEKGRYVVSDENSDRAVGQKDNQPLVVQDEEKAMLVEYWYREYNAKTKRYTINLARVAGGALLEWRKNVYEHGMYPFVLDVYSEIEGMPVGEGMVMQLAPMMRYINRYARYMDENIRASAKTRLLVRKTADLDQEALEDWNQDIITGNAIGEDAVRYMNSPPLSALAGNQMVQMQMDLKQDSGQNQFARGETAGGVTAASAIASLQEAGSKQTRMRTEALKRGFKKITEQILWLISQYYKEGRIALITGKDGAAKEVNMASSVYMPKHEGAIAPPPYVVRVNVQRMNPATVGAQNQLYIDIYKMSAQSGQNFPLSALIRMLNIDGKDRVLPVVDAVEQQTAMMNQLAAQNQQLAQTVQEQQKSIEAMKGSLLKQSLESRSTSSQAAATDAGMGMNQSASVVV